MAWPVFWLFLFAACLAAGLVWGNWCPTSLLVVISLVPLVTWLLDAGSDRIDDYLRPPRAAAGMSGNIGPGAVVGARPHYPRPVRRLLAHLALAGAAGAFAGSAGAALYFAGALAWDPALSLPVFVVGGVSAFACAAFALKLPADVLYLFFPTRPEREERRRLRGLCATCGYPLTGNLSGICPECGTRA